MDFRTYFFGLPLAEQESMAAAAGTSHAMLCQIARGHKRIELGFADVLAALSGGKVALKDLPLTDRAKFQHEARSAATA